MQLYNVIEQLSLYFQTMSLKATHWTISTNITIQAWHLIKQCPLLHIINTVSKASKVLNFVKRNLSSCLQSTKVAAYLSLVRPTLEYASSLWDSYQLVYINNIEKIQRRAARWVLNDYSRYSSVTSMLQLLQWPTLQERRYKSRLSLLYKVKNNLVAHQIPPYYITCHNETRLHHQSSFILLYIRTSAYINSFYPRTINKWNTLPSRVVRSNSLTEILDNIYLI